MDDEDPEIMDDEDLLMFQTIMGVSPIEELPCHRNTEAGEDTPLLAEMDEVKRTASVDGLVSQGTAKKYPQYLAAISATLGAFALGTSLAWTSPVSSVNGTYIDDLMKNMTAEEKADAWSWISALMPMGAAFCALFIGYLIGTFGRKMTMLGLVIPFTVGWGFIIKPSSVEMLFAGRFILGMAGGAFAVAAPVYTAEIAEKEIRGALGSYFQLMVTLGVLFVYVLGSQVSAFDLSVTCGIIPLVFAVIFFFMPETPEYLVSKNKILKAKKSLEFFRGKDYNVEGELNEIQENFARLRDEKLSFMESFSTKAAKKSLLISLGLMFIQQLSGVNAVIFFTGNIFKAANGNSDSDLPSIIVGIVQVVSTFISTLVVDRLGRKILLLISASVMCVCTMLLGVFFYLQVHEKDISSITWLPLVSLCFFMVAFSIGFGPIPWMILGELFSPAIKGTASSIACCFNWILAFLVTKFYDPISRREGVEVTFFIFMSILAVGTVFVYYFVKETKGKTQEEIQKELGD